VFEEGAPVVTTPANSSTILVNSVDITFPFTAEGGYKSSTLAPVNGTAVIKTNAAANATSGNIVVTFTAGSEAGAGSVVISVTDNNNKVGTATAVVDVKKGISITGNISENTTWETGKIYILETRISVLSGVTLTIQPGAIVKGNAGTGSNATALLIARGGKLIANGTATSPIIFTSISDNILPGQVASPNLAPDLDGLWGGLLILGNAPIAASASPKQIEGIPPSDASGLYGGTDPADNSGSIKYVSIRHGGANIGEGNEINGLTLGGVGSGTVIENVEIVANQDDGIEWFGGAVNVKNAIVWNAGDDAIDTDQAWGGTLDNFIVITPFDKCFELDGPEGSSAPAAKHIIKNGHVRAGNAVGLVDIDDAGDSKDSYLDFMNIYFYKLRTTPLQTFDALPKFYTFDFNHFEVVLPTGATLQQIFLKGSDVYATAVAEGANTVGANPTVFANTWSWAAAAGAF
jgi:co-chaperonin GroES (HSP10)